ncbi:ubiquinol-cytochrome c reductase cytochrome c1 subunit [Paragonimus westermani]|uniref:Ubiquinol-cytochrome c reductase cytochrome c1 subunit n=1 Tax=Paragonimus westermani TaxID=34504 RepID=A0A5J4NN11_9TREM|nr:ubiquinol-cytochrome c reductase cytochrome c1 subunit [Paragonimus westermani]
MFIVWTSPVKYPTPMHFWFGQAFFSWKHIRSSSWTKFALISGVAATGLVALATPVFASDMQAHPAKLPWFHNGVLSVYDHASVRRGYQVYKEVCAACHSMQYLAYRQLVNCVLTEEEAKADAAEAGFFSHALYCRFSYAQITMVTDVFSLMDGITVMPAAFILKCLL